jgi:predicted MPP superfamily phosphohydrolase
MMTLLASRPLFEFLSDNPAGSALLWLLFLGACVGHAMLVIASLNCVYGCDLPHKLLSLLRKLDGLVVLAGPVLFWFAFGEAWTLGTAEEMHLARRLLPAYVVLCWLMAFGVFPLVTLRRLLRPTPAALRSNHSQIVDVARELGYKPVGNGKHRRLAQLPGNQVFQVEFAERELWLPRVPPAWDGLTILHLTDLHFNGTPDRTFYRLVLDRCRAWEPDILAVTGDIVDSDWHHRWVIPLLGRLRWRVAAFAILGNHDSWYDTDRIRKRLARVGLDNLGNGWRLVEVRGEPLLVVGHEGPWIGPPPDLRGCPEGPFRLCLSHTPDNIRWARQHQMDLMLAGHVHGGQIRLPVVGSIFVPSRYSRKYDCGTFDEGPTLMHVSRGLAGQHPLRFNCRPEVTLLRLRQNPKPAAEA